MAKNESCEQNDLASGWVRTAINWGPGVLLIIVTGPLGGWERVVGWTAGLVWLGALCLWNYSRCRRVHCLFTGPFFLAMAIVTALVGARIVSLGQNSWSVLGNVVLVGAIVLGCGPELLWGRYWQRQPNHQAP